MNAVLTSIISGLIQTLIVWTITSIFKWIRKNLSGIKPSKKETPHSLRVYFLENLIAGSVLLGCTIAIPATWPVSARIALLTISAVPISSCWVAFEVALVFQPSTQARKDEPSKSTANSSPEE